MVEFGTIKDEEAKRLAKTDLGLIPPERRRTTGQYFIDYVQQMLEAKYGPDLVLKGGLNVYTTLNPTMQLAAEQSLREGLKALQGRTATPTGTGSTPGRPGDAPEGAVVTIEPQTGYVKAMVGGSDFFRSEFNRAVQAKRQPGSAFKPFIYIAALEAGFTPASQIEDSPVSFAVGRNGQVWKPENYDRKFRGSTTLQQAIEESINVVTVKLQERIGLAKTIQVARRLGITSPLDVNLSLALGTSDVSLLEMTSAYGALANQGVWMPPATIRYVTDAQGKLLEEHVPEGREAVAPETAYVVTQMLRGVVERGTGQAAKGLGRPVAAKTGTTNDYSNAWFVGFTPRLATGVWVGYDRPRSLGKDETGSRVAVPIWVTYMGKVLGDSPPEDFPVPDHVVSMLVDEDPSGECLRPVPMAFVKGTESGMACNGVGQPRAQALPPAPSPPAATPPVATLPPPGSAPAQPPAPSAAIGPAPVPATPPTANAPLKGQTP
jgi:penicillin-binding protein 1A